MSVTGMLSILHCMHSCCSHLHALVCLSLNFQKVPKLEETQGMTRPGHGPDLNAANTVACTTAVCSGMMTCCHMYNRSVTYLQTWISANDECFLCTRQPSTFMRTFQIEAQPALDVGLDSMQP